MHGAFKMLNLVTRQKLLEAGKDTRFGANWPGQRCLANTRRGAACKTPAMKNRERCRLHGGKSSGPNTPEGKARAAAAHTTHGRRSRAHVARVKEINAELRRVLNAMRRQGIIT